MDKVRMASPEEIKTLSDFANLTPGSVVFAYEKKDGEPDFAIVRPVVELDLAFCKTNPRRRLWFLANIETAMRATGYTEYQFEVDPADDTYNEVITHLGAERTSDPQEIRYRKVL